MSTPPVARESAPEFKVAGIPLAGVLSAIPDFGLAYVLVKAILATQTPGPHNLDWPHALMMTEFVTVHAVAFFAVVMVDQSAQIWRVLKLLGLALVYLALAAGYSSLFHSWYPFAMVGGLAFNRLLFVLLRRPGSLTAREKNDIFSVWAFNAASYILSMFVGLGLSMHIRGMQTGGADFLLYAGVLHFTVSGMYGVFSGQKLRRPRHKTEESNEYQANAVAPVENREVYGINVNLCYLFWRRVLIAVICLACVGLIGLIMPILPWLVIVSIMMISCAASMASMLFLTVRWLRYASVLIRHQPLQRLRVRVLDNEDADNVTHVALYRPGKEGPLVADLPVEPLRRQHFLAPGQQEVDADVFSTFAPNSPTIMCIGRTHLCSKIPMVKQKS